MTDRNENNEKVDALMIQNLLETWEKNEKARKINERELINEVVNSLMLPQIEAINDRQVEAFERYERNLKKHRKNHQNRIKKLGKIGGKGGK
jgi:FMN-dependent NADH-azoreductase